MSLVVPFTVLMRYPKLVLILVVSLPALLLVVLLTAAGKVTESPVPVAVSPQAIGALRPDYQTSYVRQRRIYGTAEAVQQSLLGCHKVHLIARHKHHLPQAPNFQQLRMKSGTQSPHNWF